MATTRVSPPSEQRNRTKDDHCWLKQSFKSNALSILPNWKHILYQVIQILTLREGSDEHLLRLLWQRLLISRIQMNRRRREKRLLCMYRHPPSSTSLKRVMSQDLPLAAHNFHPLTTLPVSNTLLLALGQCIQALYHTKLFRLQGLVGDYVVDRICRTS